MTSSTAELLAFALANRASLKFRIANAHRQELQLRVHMGGRSMAWARIVEPGSDISAGIEAICRTALAQVGDRDVSPAASIVVDMIPSVASGRDAVARSSADHA